MPDVDVRRATVADARQVAAVLNAVIAEGGLTLFERPFSEAEEAAFIAGLGPRSALHVAAVDGAVVGVQSVDLFAPLVTRLSSIATMGTWLGQAARGQGLEKPPWHRGPLHTVTLRWYVAHSAALTASARSSR